MIMVLEATALSSVNKQARIDLHKRRSNFFGNVVTTNILCTSI